MYCFAMFNPKTYEYLDSDGGLIVAISEALVPNAAELYDAAEADQLAKDNPALEIVPVFPARRAMN